MTLAERCPSMAICSCHMVSPKPCEVHGDQPPTPEEMESMLGQVAPGALEEDGKKAPEGA